MHPIFRRLFTTRNAIIFTIVIASSAAFWYFPDAQIVYERLENFFRELIAADRGLATVAFTLLAALSAILTFFSSTPIVPVMTDEFGRPLTLLMIIIGWLLGGIAAYGIFYGLRTFAERFTSFKKAERYSQALEGRHEILLMLLFRFAVPAELGSYALGLVRYPFWKYVLITLLGEFPFALIAVYSTTAFVNRQPLLFIGLMAFGTVAISVTFYLFYRQLRRFKPETTIRPDEDPEAMTHSKY